MPGIPRNANGVNVVSAGPRNTIVIHRDDAPSLRRHPDASRLTGCCGPFGAAGPNQVCPCGAEVARSGATINGCGFNTDGGLLRPHELHLYPDRVSSQHDVRPTAATREAP